MENELDKVEEVPELPTIPEGEEDTTDWKAEALKAQGIAKRFKTKLEKFKEVKAEAPEKEKVSKKDKSDELDYSHLAFHNSKSSTLKIESDEDLEFVKQQMQETGKPLQSLLNSNFFKTEYAAFKNAKTVDDSVPTTPSRSTQMPVTRTVEYWMNRGEELPDDIPENQQLVRDIVNARYKRAKGLQY